MDCPCTSGLDFQECCSPYIEGERSAPTAEALMRSRYAAYTLEKVDYIVDTHDPKTRKDVDRDAALTWAQQSEWLGLEIVATSEGKAEDQRGEVEFIARYALEGAEQKHHERSRFKREGDRWFYLDGDMVKAKPVVRQEPRVGRNEPCPCGSGKKFKRCHG